MKKRSAVQALELALQSGPQLSDQEVIETVTLGTWYVYISQYARLNPIEFMNVYVPAIAVIGNDEWVPQQSLFRSSKRVFEGFLNQSISPAEMQKFEQDVTAHALKLLPVYEAARTGKLRLPDDGDESSYVYNSVRSVMTAGYPSHLLQAIKPFIDQKGNVHFSQARKMLLDEVLKMGTETFEVPVLPKP